MVFAAALVFLLIDRTVLGHQLSASTGTVVVGDERITVSQEVPAEDFLHHDPSAMGRSEKCSAAWLQSARTLYEPVVLASLVIRDAEGARLSGRVHSSVITAPREDSFDWILLRHIRATYVLEYATPPQRFLTFQQHSGDGSPRAVSQLALDVRRAGERQGRLIRLTSRGNAETLEFPAGVREDRFKTVSSIIRAADAGLSVEIHVPLVLLETWRPVMRLDPDFLEPAEQAAACEGLAVYFTDVNRVCFDGVDTAGELMEIAFLPPEADALAGRSEPQRLSAWTARAAVLTRYQPTYPFATTEFTWGLFNNAVLSSPAFIFDGECGIEHEFSTYDPRLTLEHSDHAQ